MQPFTTLHSQHFVRSYRTTSVRRRTTCSVISEGDIKKCILSNGTVDFYELLGVDDDASQQEIKQAYRQLAKQCHPDRIGSQGHDVCTLLNEAYATLQHNEKRNEYNELLQDSLNFSLEGFTGTAISKWVPETAPHLAKNSSPHEDRAIWVDEVSCIGCQNCIYTACGTFRMEKNYGRARVFAQWVDTEEDVTLAMDMCPVSCIHFVHKDDLPFFEFVTQIKHADDRPSVGVMQGGMGASTNLFNATYTFIRQYKQREEAAAQIVGDQIISAKQREVYKKAIQVILSAQLGGWLGGALSNIITQIIPDENVTYDGTAVGQRKRARQRQQRKAQITEAATQQEAEERSTPIPTHLALVPVRYYQQVW